MGLLSIAWRNIGRSPVRTGMTIAAVALSLVGFLMLRTLGGTWRHQVEQTPNDRVVSRNKLGWDHDLPIFYADAIRGMDGVEDAVAVRWAGLALASRRGLYFQSNAVEARSFIDIHYELECPREQQEAFVRDRRGMLVSAQLAEELGWKLGDHVSFVSRNFQGPLELDIRGIFRSSREGFANRVLYLHLEYLNESMPLERRERASIVAAKIKNPEHGARIAKAIDIRFDDQGVRTFTMEDKALNAAITGRFSAILQAMNLVSLLTLFVVLLILVNTMVMCARERTQEFATLRAIGFGKRQIGALLLIEAGILGLLGSCAAVLLSFPVVERWVSRFAQDTMSLQPLRIHWVDAMGMLLIGTAIGVAAAYVSVRHTFKRSVVDALRYAD
jgi:putative ABC transport system permease protein